MKKAILPLLLIVMSIFIFRYILSTKVKHEISAAPKGGDFFFVKNNKKVSLEDFRGRLVVLYFGFTFCPDVCPTMLSVLKGIRNKLPATDKEKLQIVFITVDPARDTQEKIDRYVAFFDESFIALRGSEDKVRKIAKMYGVNFSKFYPDNDTKSKNYVVDHTTYALLVDKRGKLVEFLPHGEEAEIISKTIKNYL